MAELVINDPRGGHRVNSGRPPGARLTPEEHERIARLLAAGELGTNDIALTVGCSSRTVRRIRNDLEAADPHPWLEADGSRFATEEAYFTGNRRVYAPRVGWTDE